MKKLFIYGLVFATSAISTPIVQAGSPSVVGSWNISFFAEPTRNTSATQCVIFKLVPGTVDGIPTSGTWTSSFPGWSGQWVQLGDHVRWFGVTGALATTASGNLENNVNFGGVSFNSFQKETAETTAAGSWHGVRVSACKASDAPSARNDDPTTHSASINN